SAVAHPSRDSGCHPLHRKSFPRPLQQVCEPIRLQLYVAFVKPSLFVYLTPEAIWIRRKPAAPSAHAALSLFRSGRGMSRRGRPCLSKEKAYDNRSDTAHHPKGRPVLEMQVQV